MDHQPPSLSQEERNTHFKELNKNPLFRELIEFLAVMKVSSFSKTQLDLTALGNGAILEREKAIGMHQAFTGMVDFIKLDLPQATETLSSIKAKLAEEKQAKA